MKSEKMEFEIKVSEIDPIKKVFSVIASLVEVGRFKIVNSDLKFTAKDRASALFVECLFHTQAFESHQYKEGTQFTLKLERFNKILQHASSKDTLSCELIDSKLKMTLENGAERVFSLPILSQEEPQPPESDIDYDVYASINSEILSEAIMNVGIIKEEIKFSTNGKNIIISSKGQDSDAKFVIEGDKGLIDLDADKSAASKYKLDYLKEILEAREISQSTEARFSEGTPIELQFELPDKLKLTFLLAPRIS